MCCYHGEMLCHVMKYKEKFEVQTKVQASSENNILIQDNITKATLQRMINVNLIHSKDRLFLCCELLCE